eukprot:4249561-Prymnesium_polylepis.1
MPAPLPGAEGGVPGAGRAGAARHRRRRATRTSGRPAHPRSKAHMDNTWTAAARRRGVHITPARRQWW